MDGVKNWTVPIGGIVLKPNATIVNIAFFSGLASLNENMQETEAGIMFQNKVTTSVKIDNPDCVMAVNLLLGKSLIGLVEDRNKRCKIIGDLKQPLRLTSNMLNIGPNERTLGFECLMKHQAYFTESIREEFLIAGRNRAFTRGFSFGFK